MRDSKIKSFFGGRLAGPGAIISIVLIHFMGVPVDGNTLDLINQRFGVELSMNDVDLIFQGALAVWGFLAPMWSKFIRERGRNNDGQ